jgi:hypothetical protein
MKQFNDVAQAQSDIKARKRLLLPLFSASFCGQSDLEKCLFELLLAALLGARRINVGVHLFSFHLSRFLNTTKGSPDDYTAFHALSLLPLEDSL